MEYSKKQIKFFSPKNPYFEFSNYYKKSLTINGITYCCSEHFYQSEKYNYPEAKHYYKLILEADSPQKSKDMASLRINPNGNKWYINKKKPELGLMNDAIRKHKHLKLIDNWDILKLKVMYIAISEKFKDEDLQKILLSTGDNEIIEDSPYDSFWGNAKNGQNHLGKILMRVRDEIKLQKS